jgi:pre-mRNA-processing factor 40
MGTGRLKARTKWKDVYRLFKNDPRYLDLLGNSGSNPLELYWDAVDSMDQKLDAKIEIVDAAIHKYESNKDVDGDVKMDESNNRSQIAVDTTKEHFFAYLKKLNDEEVNLLTRADWSEIFDAVSPPFFLTPLEYTQSFPQRNYL